MQRPRRCHGTEGGECVARRANAGVERTERNACRCKIRTFATRGFSCSIGVIVSFSSFLEPLRAVGPVTPMTVMPRNQQLPSNQQVRDAMVVHSLSVSSARTTRRANSQTIFPCRKNYNALGRVVGDDDSLRLQPGVLSATS